MNKLIKTFIIIAGLTTSFLQTSNADIIDFNVEWSGESFGNTATASAVISIDTNLVTNPGSNSSTSTLPSWIDSITLTVSGAESGNGTYTTTDFYGALLNTSTATLDWSTELVGQSSWGDSIGDFNLFSDTGPNGSDLYTFISDGGGGDDMLLTSFSQIPEPASAALIGLSGLLIVGYRRFFR